MGILLNGGLGGLPPLIGAGDLSPPFFLNLENKDFENIDSDTESIYFFKENEEDNEDNEDDED